MVCGLVEIHQSNIVHRDLKPENIFLDKKGEDETAFIGDFGLAMIKDEERQISCLCGAGTQDYMAPEMMHSGEQPSDFETV